MSILTLEHFVVYFELTQLCLFMDSRHKTHSDDLENDFKKRNMPTTHLFLPEIVFLFLRP
ncbi:CLUMA_CG009089, isoform A [Clunio marinus]|uniref:CLUMA_CG009089, isoform A n=1 Tax=Clunio marinus TaxID=568069 RepID=A0A1J1I5M9_9DIPT|nr:CLUMA_CG009089, isoform A [Clunio marinus]